MYVQQLPDVMENEMESSMSWSDAVTSNPLHKKRRRKYQCLGPNAIFN